MSIRIAEDIENLAGVRRAVRVKRAAELLDLAPNSIYDLIHHGELEGYHAGRGHHFLRIYLDSIANYQKRKEVPATKKGNKTKRMNRKAKKPDRSTAAHRESMVFLEKMGVFNDSIHA